MPGNPVIVVIQPATASAAEACRSLAYEFPGFQRHSSPANWGSSGISQGTSLQWTKLIRNLLAATTAVNWLHLQLSFCTLKPMAQLELQEFIPFRLNRLAAEVSSELASVYTDRFGIDVVQWRILVTLDAENECSAQRVVESTRTHKSRISRGVSRLIDRNLVARSDNQRDRREARLSLTEAGKALHAEMVPVVLRRRAIS